MVLHTRIEWTKSRGRWIYNAKEDVQEKDSNMHEASTPWKDRPQWTIFIQPHRQQPDEDADGERKTGEMMKTVMCGQASAVAFIPLFLQNV